MDDLNSIRQQLMKDLEGLKQSTMKQIDNWVDKVSDEVRRSISSPCVRRSVNELGVKTGRLKSSFKTSVHETSDGVQIKLGFDPAIAPHAKFVIHGTRRIRPHPIIEQALKQIGDLDQE